MIINYIDKKFAKTFERSCGQNELLKNETHEEEKEIISARKVALVDGESALHRKIKHYLKGFVIVLDLFHLSLSIYGLLPMYSTRKEQGMQNCG